MKTIGLAANGEGFGHAARMVSLVQQLGSRYALVLYAPSTIQGFLREKLRSLAAGLVRIRTIPCFEFSKKGDHIRYWRTLKRNLPVALKIRSSLGRLRLWMEQDGIEALISDFEPISTWAARSLQIPILQLNHPGVVLRSPSIQLDALAAKLVAWLMMGTYDKKLLVSFYEGDIGPLVRRELMVRPPKTGAFLLVYVKKEYQRHVTAVLDRLGIEEYLVFPNAAADICFEDALLDCSAVITSAGHQTLSECIVLGKPVLAIPQRGQYEQRYNAQWLEKSGYGMASSVKGLAGSLPKFLADIRSGAFPKQPRLPWYQVKTEDWSDRLVKRIENFLEYDPEKRVLPFRIDWLAQWLSEDAGTTRPMELAGTDAEVLPRPRKGSA